MGAIESVILGYMYQVSYITRFSNGNIPIMGDVFKLSQSIFVKRNDQESRKMALKKIKERSNLIEKFETMPSLNIFPEGSTTNNSGLLTFKKGAFIDKKPLKIVCFKFN